LVVLPRHNKLWCYYKGTVKQECQDPRDPDLLANAPPFVPPGYRGGGSFDPPSLPPY
jgi:hypothetical protein